MEYLDLLWTRAEPNFSTKRGVSVIPFRSAAFGAGRTPTGGIANLDYDRPVIVRTASKPVSGEQLAGAEKVPYLVHKMNEWSVMWG